MMAWLRRLVKGSPDRMRPDVERADVERRERLLRREVNRLQRLRAERRGT